MNPAQPPFFKGGRRSRRAFLAGLLAISASPFAARASALTSGATRLAAAWQRGAGYQVGILAGDGPRLDVAAALDVPTRAHALLQEPDGTLLAVARRPGDWLLRWDPTGRALAWRWIEPNRAFTGHVLSDGARLYVAETDLETGAGLIGVRDARSLDKLAEWPTGGIDPHQLVWDALHPGALIVANGGVPTRPETGRLKRDLATMAASLVRLDAGTGRILGQWRLDDGRLSLRHLAWNGGRLGVALQAEHDDPAAKARAPVLALFDGEKLVSVPAPEALAGYGGDVAAAADGFAVSCPRAQALALFGPEGQWRGQLALVEACALARDDTRLLAGGRAQALALDFASPARGATLPELRLDNHWIALG